MQQVTEYDALPHLDLTEPYERSEPLIWVRK
ncbi:Uncharacterised protein [Mycobacterium xenopi]|nr:Uncharacterised protein [Mycobacterium xenopi]